MSRCCRKWYILFFLLCKGIIPSEISSENATPVYYTADNLEMLFSPSGEIEKVNLTGNVKIVFEDIILHCEKAEFNKETGIIYAEGNLYIETNQGNVKAEYVNYNLSDKTGIMVNAAFSSPPFFGKAEKIEKQGDIFYLVNGYITTCDLEKPHYRISAGRLKYVKDDYLRAERMKFILGERYSVFYFPRYTVDMKTKEPMVTAKPAYTTKTGENIEITFAQRTGAEAVIKERILIGEEGLGAGLNIYSKTKGYRSEGFLYKDWTETDIEPALLLEFLKNYTSHYGSGAILIDWRYMDNDELFYNFFHSDYIAKSKRYNYLSLTHNFNYGIFNFNLRESAGEDVFLNIEKIPEIGFYIPAFRIGESPVFLENKFCFTNFYKEEENYIRVMDILTFQSKGNIGILTFSPYLSLGGIHYSDEEEDRYNFYREAGIQFSTVLKKSHKNFTEYFSPSLKYIHRGLDYQKGEIECFDSFEKMEDGNFIHLGMDWFFENENTFAGNLSLENFYDIDKKRFDTSSLKYDIKLNPYVYFEGKNEWDFNKEKYLFGVNDIIFNSGGFSYSIGNRYDDESDISGIEGRFTQIINELWRYSAGVQYDINADDISRVSLNIWHRIHCWELNISISGKKDDFSFFVMIYPFI